MTPAIAVALTALLVIIALWAVIADACWARADKLLRDMRRAILEQESRDE